MSARAAVEALLLDVTVGLAAVADVETNRTVHLRIIVVDPLPGCAYALQRGRSEFDHAQIAAGSDLTFTTSVTLHRANDGRIDFKGDHVQGPRGGRFLYVNSGALAGQAESCWTRRAKIALEAVGNAQGDRDATLEARIRGRSADGGPACASVPLLGGGWRSAPNAE